jgi:hypothetical protein
MVEVDKRWFFRWETVYHHEYVISNVLTYDGYVGPLCLNSAVLHIGICKDIFDRKYSGTGCEETSGVNYVQ